MKISPLNKYYFDQSYIGNKHDPNHDKRRILHTLISKIWWFWTPKRVTRVTRNNTFYSFSWLRMCTMSYLTPPPGFECSSISQSVLWASAREKGATAEYKPHAGLDTSLTSTSLIWLIPSWTCFKSIIMRMAAAWIRQSPREKPGNFLHSSQQYCQLDKQGQ